MPASVDSTFADEITVKMDVVPDASPEEHSIEATRSAAVAAPRAWTCPPHLETLYRASIALETAAHYEHALRNTLNGVGQWAFVLKQCLRKRRVLGPAGGAFAEIEARLRKAAEGLATIPIERAPEEMFDVGDAVTLLLDWVYVPGGKSLDVVPLQLVAQRAELELAVFCLIENAAEAVSSKGGGRVHVRIRRFRRDAAIEVHDDGPGLGALTVDTLFARFFTNKPNHLGLGLPIARLLARRLGGNVVVVPSDLGGVCARITLFDDAR
jgi:signal transduction histidine kinase